jgi:hypothetical protein
MDGDPEYFRILALSDGTMVQTSLPAPDDSFILQAGAIHQIMTNTDFTVKASKAVMIGQFQMSQDSSSAETGDPSFLLVPPVAQHRSEYIFLVPSGYMENWIMAAIPTNGPLMLDGQPLTSGCERVMAGSVGNLSYDAVRCPISPGAHTISSTLNFGLLVEGWGPGPVSYAYPAGMDFQTVNNDCTNDGDCPTGEFCSGGECTPIIQIM